jgi:hypothetical protein
VNGNDNNKPQPSNPPRTPSTGEGADSALDALRRKREEKPPPDSTLPGAV